MKRNGATPVRPSWVSNDLFPFDSQWYQTPDGHQMHYIDEGEGAPIVCSCMAIHPGPLSSVT